MAKNKETTIDELATMVQKGFQSMDEKMDKGFESVNKRFDRVEGRVVGLESKMDTMVKQIDNLQRGQVRIEDRLDEIAPRVKEHEKRITILEKKVLLAT
jgi:peptidoglycan hydrolase CwlO-like protein